MNSKYSVQNPKPDNLVWRLCPEKFQSLHSFLSQTYRLTDRQPRLYTSQPSAGSKKRGWEFFRLKKWAKYFLTHFFLKPTHEFWPISVHHRHVQKCCERWAPIPVCWTSVLLSAQDVLKWCIRATFSDSFSLKGSLGSRNEIHGLKLNRWPVLLKHPPILVYSANFSLKNLHACGE